MRVRTISCVFGPYGKRAFSISSEPWWTYVMVVTSAWVCGLTGHRWCNSCLLDWAVRLSEKHADTFIIPADHDLLLAYGRWRKFEWPIDEDEDTEDEDNK